MRYPLHGCFFVPATKAFCGILNAQRGLEPNADSPHRSQSPGTRLKAEPLCRVMPWSQFSTRDEGVSVLHALHLMASLHICSYPYVPISKITEE